MVERGKLCILAGIDGSGKTTLLNSLEIRGFNVSHWRRLKLSLSLLEASKLNFANPSWVVQQLEGRARFDFLWAYIDAEWKHVISPNLEKSNNVIADGFLVRFLAKEMAYNKLDSQLFLDNSPLTGDEQILIIDTPPELALERKGEISPYECFTGRSDFLDFQKKQRDNLFEISSHFRQQVFDGTAPKEILLDRVLDFLRNERFTASPSVSY